MPAGRTRPVRYRPAAASSHRTSPAVMYEREFMLRDLSSTLFASLPRRDQRHKGEQYLRGLLTARGRRSIRNVAACLGDPTLEQTLHHFICNSTWEWRPVREALACWVGHLIAPRAWVVRQTPIPKSGSHSVGVGRGFDLHRNQMFHGQQAFGVWCASPEAAAPVNWRLVLPERRGEGGEGSAPGAPGGRSRGHTGETPEECATTAALDFADLRGAPLLPVVLDLPARDPDAVVRRFAAAGVPVLVRVGPGALFTVEEPAPAGFAAGALPAHRILDSVRGRRQRVGAFAPDAPAGVRHATAVKVRVGLPGGTPVPRDAREGALALLGEWREPHGTPSGLWLTNMGGVPAATLLGLTRLTDRVGRDFAEHGDRAGLRDFEGRSLRGWHCHMTLASAAHALQVLAAARRGREEGYVPKVS
ncbi:transposase [Streptomyces sp. NPDC051597]|uniref:IS701 family transposase n=1 Tax=Streptomyces sp. NPDC051597 TaxID=3155049 RepID=UPI0034478835